MVTWNWPLNRSYGLPLTDTLIPQPSNKEAGREVNALASLSPHPSKSCSCFPSIELVARRQGNPLVLSMWVSLTGHHAGWRRQRSASWGTQKTSSAKGYIEKCSKCGVVEFCFYWRKGYQLYWVHVWYNEDLMTITTLVTYTFCALGSIKALRIWINDGI